MIAQNKLDIQIQIAEAPLILRMSFQDYQARTSWNVLPHSNTDYDIHVCLSGNYVMDVDGQEIFAEASQVLLIPPGLTHRPLALSDDFERFSFTFMPASSHLASQFFEQLHTCSTVELPPETLSLCRGIIAEMSEETAFGEDALKGMFTLFFAILFRRLHLQLTPTSTDTLPNTAWRTAIIEYYFSPWPKNFGTEQELATRLNLSRRQLNRILMQKYGMGFRQKMLQTRMEYAASLLRTTDTKIAEIGITAGYTAEASFYKAFHTYYGVTPLEYRNQHTPEGGETRG